MWIVKFEAAKTEDMDYGIIIIKKGIVKTRSYKLSSHASTKVCRLKM
jgi:hypothetical protein